MKIIDAINILSITEKTITEQIVKKAYRRASKTYHPDVNPAGLSMMKAVNEAYETLINNSFPLTVSEFGSTNNYGEVLNDALNKIIKCPDIIIEVCGSWIWVSGETKKNKDALNEAKFIWNNKKKMWYFRPQEEKRKFYRGKLSIDEIRVKYGSDRLQTSSTMAIC